MFGLGNNDEFGTDDKRRPADRNDPSVKKEYQLRKQTMESGKIYYVVGKYSSWLDNFNGHYTFENEVEANECFDALTDRVDREEVVRSFPYA